jgi:outer membrane receptor protein involved in Fe transport
MSDTTELTLGARWYDIEVDFEGSANSSFGNGFGNPDEQRYGTNLSVQYAPGNPNGYPDKAKTDGVIGKVTYSWRPKDDVMYYVTWSEGFRPGLLNRPVGAGTDAYRVKPEVESDEITNMEFGWKTILLDGQLRFNGSMFSVDVEGLQSTILDPAMNVNLFFSDNAANGTIRGMEGDFTYLTNYDGLSIAGAYSFLSSEITKKLLPTNDVVEGAEMAFAPGYQGNVRVRQEFGMSNGYVGHAQVQLVYSDGATSDIMEPNKAKQNSYSYLDLRVGMSSDDITAELYIDNVTDKRAEISNNFVFDRQRVTVIKPMTVGIRVKKNF